MSNSSDWPCIRSFDRDHLHAISLPLGGIGTGTIGLGGRGDLRDWECFNAPSKGFTPCLEHRWAPFPLLWWRPVGGQARMRCLEGPLHPVAHASRHWGTGSDSMGLPRLRDARFHAGYPGACLELGDPDLPLEISLIASNPCVPADEDASSWPLASLRYRVHNPTDSAFEAAICWSMPNAVGAEPINSGSDWIKPLSGPRANRNEFRHVDGLSGIVMDSQGVDREHPAWGSMTLALLHDHTVQVSQRCAWPQLTWANAMRQFLDEIEADGRLQDHPPSETNDSPSASLCGRVRIEPGATADLHFLITWHFPNRRDWHHNDAGRIWGNHYCNRWRDAWQVAVDATSALPDLEQRTRRFLDSLLVSDLPRPVLDACLGTLSALRSQTTFRTADGRYHGWEGCNDLAGCCWGSCTHVWNYEQATGFLFGDMAARMRSMELESCDTDGAMPFRIHIDPEQQDRFRRSAADGQMGSLLRFYREWRHSGDTDWLREHWPAAKRALAYAWSPDSWDADRDGLMEGRQHNTMDVDFHGPHPQITGWYLAALLAMAELAEALGENREAADWRALARSGAQAMDAQLFNGAWYEQLIRPAQGRPEQSTCCAYGCTEADTAADTAADLPPDQLGPGCLIDQLVGPTLARLCGIDVPLHRAHVRSALASIWQHNRRAHLHDHWNGFRTYALADEAAVLMASWPRGGRPAIPFPYADEVMTGFEYTAAIGLIQAGLLDEGLQVTADVRARHDGLRRNPFDECECGHHYARAMASWGLIPAMSGFCYHAARGELHIDLPDQARKWFWSTGWAWGTIVLEPDEHGCSVELQVEEGHLHLNHIHLGELQHDVDKSMLISPHHWRIRLEKEQA